MSKLGLNNIDNTIFPIDQVIKKYAKVDTSKYNYLKLENYTTSFVQFDKLRLHLPTSFSFDDNGYIGLHVRIYTYDYTNNNVVDFSSFLYDDTAVGSDKNIILNQEFFYDQQSWGKYLTFDIPSIDAVSKQRTSTTSTNIPSINSINDNLTKANGISETAPIFIEFTFVINREELLGNTYYHMSDIYTKSISKTPEYADLAANIEQATDGDYFWIYGSYGGSNESMDNFINEIYSKGRKVQIEYDVTLYEENILMNTQKYIVTENFTKKQWYRPVLSFTNTTASIDVTMNIIDLVDNSVIDRTSSISLTSEIFKYGKKLISINIDNAWKPKIYNMKNSNVNSYPNVEGMSDISITKVNYPVISDRTYILVGVNPSIDTTYKAMGLAKLRITPFGNTVTFNIASSSDNNATAIPYNLTNITQNSSIVLTFKSDTDILEKKIWQETDVNDYEHGIIVYRIEESDLILLKKIGTSNKKFYLTIKADNTGVKSLLYTGTWDFLDDLKFIDTSSNNSTGTDLGNFKDSIITNTTDTTVVPQTPTTLSSNNTNSNAIVFLNSDANIGSFDIYLQNSNINIYLKKSGGNTNTLTYMYFLLNLSPIVIQDIKDQPEVLEITTIPFSIGLNTTGTNSISVSNIRNRTINFNSIESQRQDDISTQRINSGVISSTLSTPITGIDLNTNI